MSQKQSLSQCRQSLGNFCPTHITFVEVKNRASHRTFLSLALMCLLYSGSVNAQSIVEGYVMDAANNEMLIGVDVSVLGTENVVKTNIDGRFLISVNLDVAATLLIHIKGYQRRSITVSEPGVIKIELDRVFSQAYRTVDITTLSKGEIMRATWTIDAVSGRELLEAPVGSGLNGLANYTSVFAVRTGHLMRIPTMRGFAMSEVGRALHLVDGVDISVPDFGGALSLLTTPSEIDIAQVEMLTGPASSLHGSGAYSGAFGYRTKNAWEQQGLTFAIRGGTGSELNAQVRFALPFGKNKRFAIKLVGQFSRVDDEYGNHFQHNTYGKYSNTASFEYALTDNNDYGFSTNQLQSFNRFTTWLNNTQPNGLPATFEVKHDAYSEQRIAEQEARSIKLNGGLFYNAKDKVLLSYNYKFGYGSGVYQAEERFQLHNFLWQQHSVKAVGGNWEIAAFGNFTHSGNSYQLRITAENITELGGLEYVKRYLIGYVDSLEVLSNGFTASVSDSAILGAEGYALAQGSSGWYKPGTARFDSISEVIQNSRNPSKNAALNLRSSVQQAQAKYVFNLKWFDVLLGAHGKREHPGSEGLFYSDTTSGLAYLEFGGLTKLSVHLFKEKLLITAGVRVDKNELFRTQINPRFAFNFSHGLHTFRASYQTGYRNPNYWELFRNSENSGVSQQGNAQGFEHVYAANDVLKITDLLNRALLNNVWPSHCPPGDLDCLHQWAADSISAINIEKLKPEHITSFEAGYRGVILKNLYLDVAGHYSLHKDRIYYRQLAILTKNPTSQGAETIEQLNPDSMNYVRTSTAVNAASTMASMGVSVNFTFHFSDRIWINTNYSFSKLLTKDDVSLNTAGFNVPTHRYNMGIRFRKIWRGFGFSLNYQWSEGYTWASRMGVTDIPNQSILDAQISYEIPKLHTTVRIGGTNIVNDPYRSVVGGPRFRSSLYASVLFDLSVR